MSISLEYLVLYKGAAVLKDKTVSGIFVEFSFLDVPPEELETPNSIPKPKPGQKVTIAFRKGKHIYTNFIIIPKNSYINRGQE